MSVRKALHDSHLIPIPLVLTNYLGGKKGHYVEYMWGMKLFSPIGFNKNL